MVIFQPAMLVYQRVGLPNCSGKLCPPHPPTGPQGTKSGAFAAAQLGTEEKSGKDSPPTFFESRLSEEWREDTNEKCENSR